MGAKPAIAPARWSPCGAPTRARSGSRLFNPHTLLEAVCSIATRQADRPARFFARRLSALAVREQRSMRRITPCPCRSRRAARSSSTVGAILVVQANAAG